MTKRLKRDIEHVTWISTKIINSLGTSTVPILLNLKLREQRIVSPQHLTINLSLTFDQVTYREYLLFWDNWCIKFEILKKIIQNIKSKQHFVYIPTDRSSRPLYQKGAQKYSFVGNVRKYISKQLCHF